MADVDAKLDKFKVINPRDGGKAINIGDKFYFVRKQGITDKPKLMSGFVVSVVLKRKTHPSLEDDVACEIALVAQEEGRVDPASELKWIDGTEIGKTFHKEPEHAILFSLIYVDIDRHHLLKLLKPYKKKLNIELE